jgi:phosphoribosylanthranilate isomerase
MEIKICGLTSPKEASYLNEAGADYAGFVFFEKSKRNVSISRAKEIMAELDEHIRTVAVTVSPDTALLRQLTEAGFSIVQIHGNLTREVLEEAQIPVWYAINIAKEEELAARASFLQDLPQELSKKIEGIVVDGAEYGSGKTFDWKKSKRLKKAGAQSPPTIFDGRLFVLAGGLNPENVREGIDLFGPDVADVSSGVEYHDTTAIPPGKDKKLIFDFIRKARGYE